MYLPYENRRYPSRKRNVLHAGFMEDMQDGKYVSITFLPKIIYGSYESVLRRKYVEPFVQNFSLPAIYIDHSQPWHQLFAGYVKDIIRLYEEKNAFMNWISPELCRSCGADAAKSSGRSSLY